MKEIFLQRKAWLLVCFVVLSVAACQKDEHTDIGQAQSEAGLSPEVRAAKAWLEQQQGADQLVVPGQQSANSASKSTLKAQPLWEKAWVGRDEVVEVPLQLTNKVAYSTNPNATEAELDAQVTRLVVLKDKQGEPFAVLMHIMGDVSYLQQKSYTLEGNRYRSMESGFTGNVLYSYLDGRFANGWRYENGKVVATITAQSGLSMEPSGASPVRQGGLDNCIVWYTLDWEIRCTVTETSNTTSCYWVTTGEGWWLVCEVWEDENDHGTPEDDPPVGGTTGGQTPDTKDPCEQIKAMREDPTLTERIRIFTERAEYFVIEDGLLTTNNGFPYPPKRRGLYDVEFEYHGTFTEAVHLHPKEYGGIHIFSPGDINELYKMLKGGHIADTASFRSVVVTAYATSGALHITDLQAFEAFGKKYGLGGNYKEDLKTFDDVFNRVVQLETATSLEQVEANFLRLLEGSGLSFSVGFHVGNETLWYPKSLQNEVVVTINCP